MDTPSESPVRPANDARFPWSAVIWAGIISSLVFQVLEAVLIPLFAGDSPWGPMRMIAAMVLGRSVLPPPSTFDPGAALVALVVDIVLAIIYVFFLSWFIRFWRLRPALVAAAVFGVALFVINFYGFTAVFPWFVMGRNLVTLFTHIVFSVTAVLVFKKLAPASSQAAAAVGGNP